MQHCELDLKQLSTKDRPLFLLDSGLCCIFSGDDSVLKLGADLKPLLRRDIELAIEKACCEHVFINRQFCCAMITPVKSGGMQCYMCEMIDKHRAVELFSHTDAGADTLPVLKAMEYSISELWQQINLLESTLPYSEVLENMRGTAYRMSAVIKSNSSYFDGIFGDSRKTLFDINRLCTQLVAKCNAILAKCGRSVELVCSCDSAYVRLDSRRTIMALVSAIQNSLLYSPRDHIPAIFVGCNDGYVEIRVQNENIVHTADDFSEDVDIDMPFQRIGSGMRLIRDYTRQCGGSYSLDFRDGLAVLTLTLPAATEAEVLSCHLEEEFFTAYVTGIPDFAEVLMQETAEFFTVEKTANLQ